MNRLVLTFALTVATFTVLAVAQGPAKTFTGVITDTMCGADHAHMGIAPDARCVRDCVKAGKQWKYALLTADQKMHILSDQAAPEKFAAKKVKVTGVLYEKTGILRVDKIEAAD
ncbi:MAG: hypothetical protein M9913_08475 [Bryobacteraceae bacterium]|nr:hypothetical protein [Solibacteraceae bacterium]MCO5350919.1 hypothetical protein [Bryobacteraceae bacterium]